MLQVYILILILFSCLPSCIFLSLQMRVAPHPIHACLRTLATSIRLTYIPSRHDVFTHITDVAVSFNTREPPTRSFYSVVHAPTTVLPKLSLDA
ncbi:hypothetical protein B0H14DRAFT_2726720 [Mycena olivaceomarginata]|nr:hypothetical protein B0H14DRAFT_2726720 [Mycena olivaceomarginata]